MESPVSKLIAKVSETFARLFAEHKFLFGFIFSSPLQSSLRFRGSSKRSDGFPGFNGAEFMHFIELATHITVNVCEAELLVERTGERMKNPPAYLNRVE